jgi:uncharacterized protein YfaS (alpha-2-macroglobulin family)
LRLSSGSISLALCVLVAAACSTQAPPPPKPVAVAALPKPTLPPWILSISPTSNAQSLAQIRVIFNKPVTKVEALSGDGPRDVLSHLAIEPALKGRFTVLTPRMIGFVAEQALPVGMRVRVTLTAGLRDLDGDVLNRDLAWTFATEALAFSDLPQPTASPDESTPPPSGLLPTIPVTANAQVDPASLASHVRFSGAGDVVPVTVKLEAQPTPYPGSDAAQAFDPALKTWVYDVTPQRNLRVATRYAIDVEPGVEPAYGNVPTQRHFQGAIHTYDALAIVPTPVPSPGGGGGVRFANGDPVVVFNNPLDPKSIAGALKVSPAPANVKALTSLSEDGTTLSIDPYALDPNATYVATVSAGIKDLFGQTLGRDQNVTIHTGGFAPGAWAPAGVNVMPAGLGIALNFYATNLPGDRYRSAYARVRPENMLVNPDALSNLPASTGWPAHQLAGARPNVQSTVKVPLQRELGGSYGALAYGFRTALDRSDAQPGLVGIAQLTNLGVFAQWFPQRGIVLVQHLNDGAPAGGVRVQAYRNVDSNSTGAPQACASATTSAAGEADFSGVDVERCYAGAQDNQAPSVAVIATEGSDVATLTTSSYSGIYRFNVNGGWSSGAPLSRGIVFSDRQMYQPGEKGEITGIAYYVSGSRILPDRNASYAVTLLDPSNNKSSLGTATTDAYGVFSMPIAFSKQQALGYYTIDAKGASGNDIDGSLRVAEFKPPNFKLTLDLSAPAAAAGNGVTASATAAYLFGAPLQGGVAHAYVTRELATVQPKGWDDFSFGRQWFWPEENPSFDTDVLQRDVPLDAQGKASLDVAVPADLPFPMTYDVDMEATDVSNLSVSDSKSFLALPADATIGLASGVVGAAGKPMQVRAIVTAADGKAIAGRGVHVELQKMTYTSATQQVEGGQDAQEAVKYDTVATADATSADAPVTLDLTPPDAGPYRVRANFAGAKNDASATDLQVFAFGAGEADWGQSDVNAVAVKLDKKSYAIGDTATALVASPFETSDVYVAVVRGDTIYRTTLHNVKGAARVPFKITQDMLPNAAFEAVVVRRGANLASLKPGSLDTLERVGMAAFDVDVADRYLTLAIAPQAATVAPGGSQRVAFTLSKKNGGAARGEIVAMVVNDAILQLSGYRLPDLVQTVFADQPISTIFSDNRDGIVLKTQTAPLEKGFGYGGGYLAGAASTRVRQNFLPLAYYGRAKTDAAGKATVSFSMPDDLTTWRVMAVAIGDDDAHFATGDATFLSNLPLMTNPLLPQFARTGDAFDAGVSIANQTGAAGSLELTAGVDGALSFTSGDPHVQKLAPQAATGMQAFRFPVLAGTPAPATFRVNSVLGAHGDAFSVPFAVSDRATTDSVIETGVAAKSDASVPIALNRGGWLHVTLANSIVPQFAVPSNRMMTADALPLADESASRLIVASALRGLRAPYRLKLDFDPNAETSANLTRLLAFQRGDGGFGEVSRGNESDPFVSAYALDALLFARSHGASVDSAATARAAAFMARTLANPGRFLWCNDAACKAQLRFEALWALAAGGDRRTDFLSDVVAQSGNFDSATQIRLARYLLQTPGWQSRGASMASHAMQTLYVSGRYAVASVTTRWGWMGSLVDAQSQMLQLLMERRAPSEQLDGAVRALGAQQCKCGWQTMDDTASALTALAAYASTERLTPGSASVRVGDATIASASFGSTAASQTFAIAASSLHGNAAIVHPNGGTVHYTLLYTYPVPAGAPGELAAFRVVRQVSEPGATAPPLATMELSAAPPVKVAPGRVFDVDVRVIVDHPVDRLVIEDPLPAGFEAVDTSFQTTLKAVVPQSDSWEIDSQQIYRDRIVAYASHLGPGVYDVHYLVRSVTTGRFAWPGAHAYLQDAPEQFGRSAATTLEVTGS